MNPTDIEILRQQQHNDTAALNDRIEQLELAHVGATSRIVGTMRYNRRIIVFSLIWVTFVVCLGAMIAIDVYDGNLDETKKITSLIELMAGTIAGLSAWIVSGKADKLIN